MLAGPSVSVARSTGSDAAGASLRRGRSPTGAWPLRVGPWQRSGAAGHCSPQGACPPSGARVTHTAPGTHWASCNSFSEIFILVSFLLKSKENFLLFPCKSKTNFLRMRLVIKQYLMTEHPIVNYLIIKKQERELGEGRQARPRPPLPLGFLFPLVHYG